MGGEGWDSTCGQKPGAGQEEGPRPLLAEELSVPLRLLLKALGSGQGHVAAGAPLCDW